jgi:tetratricopeptide (TPR) repeat protein
VPPVSPGERPGTVANQGGIVQLDSVGARVRPAVVIMATVMSLGVVSPPAWAQTTDREARDHFRRGKEAYAAQRFDEAYREFEAGYRLSHRPLFLFNMGHARRRGGDPAEARALFRRFLELQPDSPHRAEVEAILHELEPPAPPSPAPSKPEPPALSLPPPPQSVVAVPPRTSAEPPPSPRRWWLWAGAGGAVVAGVLVAFLARGRDSYTKQGSLGTLGSP